MSYYYQSHIRNLEKEASIEKQKIEAELYQKQILNESKKSLLELNLSGKKSRKIQDQELAAYLQRSILSAQLSAMRSKTQESMTRSRLESAFQLRKQNQKTNQELDKMNHKHKILIQQSYKQVYETNKRALISKREAEVAVRYKILLQELACQQSEYSAHKLARSIRDRYYYY